MPWKLILADDDLGLVPLIATPAGEPGAVLLHRSGLLAALDALFELAWRHAYRLTAVTASWCGPAPTARATWTVGSSGCRWPGRPARLGLSTGPTDRGAALRPSACGAVGAWLRSRLPVGPVDEAELVAFRIPHHAKRSVALALVVEAVGDGRAEFEGATCRGG